MDDIRGNLIIKGDAKAVETAILDFLEKEMSQETTRCQFKVRLVLTELLANSFLHGNGASEDKEIQLGYQFSGRSLMIRIKDEGSGFVMSELIKPLTEGITESGRGLAIVQEIAESLTVEESGEIIAILALNKL